MEDICGGKNCSQPLGKDSCTDFANMGASKLNSSVLFAVVSLSLINSMCAAMPRHGVILQNDDDDDSSKMRAGICITGQITRLELESKLKHLIKPNLKSYAIDLVIIVDPESSSHVNIRDAKGEGAKIGNSALDAATIKKAASKLPLNKFSLVLYEQETAVNPDNLERYMASLNKEYMTRGERKKRALSHIRQWYTMKKCGEYFGALSKANGKYDVLVRIRDDMNVLKPIHLEKLPYGHKMLSLDCQFWYGINDKIAVLDGMFLDQYFNGPITSFNNTFDTVWTTDTEDGEEIGIWNPETWLLGTMLSLKVPLQQVSIEQLPVVPSKFRPNGDVCFLSKIFALDHTDRKRLCIPRKFYARVRRSFCCEPKCPLLNNFGRYGSDLQKLGVPTSVFAKEATVMRKNYADAVKQAKKQKQRNKEKEWLTGAIGLRGGRTGRAGRNRRTTSELNIKFKPGGEYNLKKTQVSEEDLPEEEEDLENILNALA
jgi:hypothetical protein